MATTIIFLLALTALVFAHELGHFLVARFFKVRVDEFAIGFPPRLFSWKRGQTEYTFNLLPIGGYVKIFGEDPEDTPPEGEAKREHFASKPRYAQALILVAGVTFNIIFAYLLFLGALTTGLPLPLPADKPGAVTINSVLPDSPAETAGFMTGDVILSVNSGEGSVETNKVTDFQAFVSGNEGGSLKVKIRRGGEEKEIPVTPIAGIVENGGAIGIGLSAYASRAEVLKSAPITAFRMTYNSVKGVTLGFYNFIIGAFKGESNIKDVAGPVGIAGMVGSAAKEGLPYFLSFLAYISINLAVINILPFPALDGGRLLFVGIEGALGRNLPARFQRYTNAVGFVLLILLMIFITYRDILKLF
ncbi:MAG: RIP metalloprotease RseP [Patescibacteria group bacterium]